MKLCSKLVFPKHDLRIWHTLRIQTSLFLMVALFELQKPANDAEPPEHFVAERKCLCVSRKVVFCSIHQDIQILVPISYLKLRSYIYRRSHRQREATGGHGRPREATGGHGRTLGCHGSHPGGQRPMLIRCSNTFAKSTYKYSNSRANIDLYSR